MPDRIEVRVSLREMLRRMPSLEKLREAPGVRAKLAFQLAPLVAVAGARARDFEQARTALFKRLGEKQPDNSYKVPPEKLAEFTGEIDELLDSEVVLALDGGKIGIPANFEMPGLVAVAADWADCLEVKE